MKFKTQLNYAYVEALYSAICDIVMTTPALADDDKLLHAVLDEIARRLYIKMAVVKDKYTISFTPAQAIALRILYLDYIQDHRTYLGNKLHAIANQVNQQFFQNN